MKRSVVLLCWAGAYAALLLTGWRFGVRPMTVFIALTVLSIPPLRCALRASSAITRRTANEFPHEWQTVKSDVRTFIYDDRTFGDTEIAAAKGELRWWTRAGVIAMVLFLPTMLLIQKLAR
jgi:hypothetical protein